MSTPTNDLRTALEALVTDVQDEPYVVLKQIRALLAAHPASAPVSDTRREDVQAVLEQRDAARAALERGIEEAQCRIDDPAARAILNALEGES